MTFLEKIKPHLISDDFLVQETVLHALSEYPNVPEEWTVELLREVLRNKDKQSSILIYLEHQVINEEALKVLLEILQNMDKKVRHIGTRLLENIEPKLVMTYKNELSPYLSEDMVGLFDVLLNGNEEEINIEYVKTLEFLVDENPYRTNLIFKAKMLAKCIVENGWITEKEIESTINNELKEEWFSYEGIFTVYMIGLLRIEKFIPVLAKLLIRDEDMLLEHVTNALIQFQSDEVVKEVAPFLKNEDSVIFAASAVANIKSALAVKVLIDAYRATEELDSKDLLVESLCQQLSPDALPIISEHMNQEYHSSLVDVEQVVYGFYRIIGEDHPHLEAWNHYALNPEIDFDVSEKPKVLIRNGEKVGRNDPCLCGSGKKYKKCCGNK
jgi:HEAT repeat protein